MNGVGDDGGYVRFHAPHLGSGLRRKDGVVGFREVFTPPRPRFRPSPEREVVGFDGRTWSVSRKRDVGHLKQSYQPSSSCRRRPPFFPFTMIPFLAILSEAEGSRAEGLGVTGLCAADSSASLRMTLWEDVGQGATFDPGRPLHGS